MDTGFIKKHRFSLGQPFSREVHVHLFDPTNPCYATLYSASPPFPSYYFLNYLFPTLLQTKLFKPFFSSCSNIFF